MESKDFKYNYILYNMENGSKWHTYAELHNKDFIRMCKGALPMNEPFLHKLHKLHWSAKLNNKIKLPFKKLWFKKMTDGKFKDNKPVCFILYGGQYAIRDPRICDYIRKLNPENKIAIHYRDLLKNEAKHIDALKKKADIIYTYDKGDAQAHNLVHYQSNIYSRICETTEPSDFSYDLYFIGYPKDRLNLIYRTYDVLTKKNIRCCFKLVGVDPAQRKSGDGLYYYDKPIPYKEIVSDIQATRCILEISQQYATGATMRTLEALTYKRKLLTNRQIISDESNCNPLQVSHFDKAEDINPDFLSSPIPYDKLEDISCFSPFRELEFVEECFAQKENR